MATADGCEVEELAHTSEVGVRVRARDAATLFGCAALGMFRLLDAPTVAYGVADADAHVEQLVIEAPDAQSLMVDWLNELLYLHEISGRAPVLCSVEEWSPQRMRAEVVFGPLAQPPRMQIKAVTYHQLVVAQHRDGWLAEVYFDI